MAEQIVHSPQLVTHDAVQFAEFAQHRELQFVQEISKKILDSRKGVGVDIPQPRSPISRYTAKDSFWDAQWLPALGSKVKILPADNFTREAFYFLSGGQETPDTNPLDRFAFTLLRNVGSFGLDEAFCSGDRTVVQKKFAEVMPVVQKMEVMTAKAIFLVWSKNPPPGISPNQLPSPDADDDTVRNAFLKLYEGNDAIYSDRLGNIVAQEVKTLMLGFQTEKARTLDVSHSTQIRDLNTSHAETVTSLNNTHERAMITARAESRERGQREAMSVFQFITANHKTLAGAVRPSNAVLARRDANDQGAIDSVRRFDSATRIVQNVERLGLGTVAADKAQRLAPVLATAMTLDSNRFQWDETKGEFIISDDQKYYLKLLVEGLQLEDLLIDYPAES